MSAFTSEYEMVIGLEVHVELKTRTKIFCSCPTDFGAEPNNTRKIKPAYDPIAGRLRNIAGIIPRYQLLQLFADTILFQATAFPIEDPANGKENLCE